MLVFIIIIIIFGCEERYQIYRKISYFLISVYFYLKCNEVYPNLRKSSLIWWDRGLNEQGNNLPCHHWSEMAYLIHKSLAKMKWIRCYRYESVVWSMTILHDNVLHVWVVIIHLVEWVTIYNQRWIILVLCLSFVSVKYRPARVEFILSNWLKRKYRWRWATTNFLEWDLMPCEN